MGSKPSISVVIPAYNAALFIEEAIRSVLAQDYKAREIIVVDDGSTDMDYLKLAALDPSVKVIVQPNLGVSSARNTGCSVATGDCIAFLDADDAWLSGKLREQVEFLRERPGIAAVFTRGFAWRPSMGTWRWPLAQEDVGAKDLLYRDFLMGIPVSPSSMLILMETLRAVGPFDQTMSRGEDFDFYFRLSFAHRTAVLNSRLVLYRRHGKNATATHYGRNALADVIKASIRARGRTDAFGNHLSKMDLRKRLSDVHFQHGYGDFWSGHPWKAAVEFAKAARFGAGRKAFIYFVLASVPGSVAILRRLKARIRPAPRLDSTQDGAVIEIPEGLPTAQ